MLKKIPDVAWFFIGVLGAFIAVVAAFFFLLSIDPTWKSNQRRLNQELRNSTEKRVSIVISRDRMKNIIIPPTVIVQPDGTLTGNPDDIAKIHYQAYELDFEGVVDFR